MQTFSCIKSKLRFLKKTFIKVILGFKKVLSLRSLKLGFCVRIMGVVGVGHNFSKKGKIYFGD